MDDDERLARLICSLPPAPAGWVAAARELPAVWRDLDEFLARACADRDLRQALEEDLAAALEASGREPDPLLLAALRVRLSGSSAV